MTSPASPERRRGRASGCGITALAVVLALVAAGCGSSDGASVGASPDDTIAASAAPATEVPTSEADAFPVTIQHAFGSSTIESPPERVVVVGLHEADFLYSLGIAPVGVHEWWGGYPYATGPWADGLREELGATPEVLEGFDVNVEWVAELDPDLIVATYHDIDEHTYDLLSAIAPVVVQHADYETSTTPWREELRQIAEATGRSDQAEQVIAGVDDTIAQIVEDHPSLDGAHFDTGGMFDAATVTTYSSEDVLNRVLAELGMAVPAELDELADGVYIELPAEQLDRLDTLDTFIWLDDTGTNEDVLADLPTYTATGLSSEGRSIFPNRDLVLAMSFNTPLSIPYYLQSLAPMLDAALDGDPATEVPD